MHRRDFIKQTLKATALAAAAGGVGLLFHDRRSDVYQKLVVQASDFPVPDDPAWPRVTLARDENHIAALKKALDGVGGMDRFIRPGERVVIKPNIGWDRAPEQAANTNPILVAETVRQCLSAGAATVIVTDVSCNHPPRCFIRSGIREAAEGAGATVILPRDEDFVRTNIGGTLLTVWPVLRHFLEADRLINLPIIKQHSLTTCTIGLKNLFGVIGGRRNQLHQQIDQSIVDLANSFRPTLTIIDATRVLLRGGPTGGSLDDVARKDTVICATDQVAGDARAVEFLGLPADAVTHIVLAGRSKLGNIDYRQSGYKEILA